MSLDAAERQARLRVTDAGRRDEPRLPAFAFERFRQEDATSTRAHHGLGLGLYVVHHVIAHHGGVVNAESNGHRRGSRLHGAAPIAAAPGASPLVAETSRESDNRPQAGLKVLLVDDEADAREALRLILQQHGMIVTTAASASRGARARRAADRHPPERHRHARRGRPVPDSPRAQAALRPRWPGPGDRALRVCRCGRPSQGTPGRVPASRFEAGRPCSSARRDRNGDSRWRRHLPSRLNDSTTTPLPSPLSPAAHAQPALPDTL